MSLACVNVLCAEARTLYPHEARSPCTAPPLAFTHIEHAYIIQMRLLCVDTCLAHSGAGNVSEPAPAKTREFIRGVLHPRLKVKVRIGIANGRPLTTWTEFGPCLLCHPSLPREVGLSVELWFSERSQPIKEMTGTCVGVGVGVFQALSDHPTSSSGEAYQPPEGRTPPP